MEHFSDESDNDLDRLVDQDHNNFGDVSDEDEAIEDNSHNYEDGEAGSAPPAPKPVKVKRPVLNPQPKLNFETLQGPKGLLALNDLFKDHKFRGNGFEKEDLSDLLERLEQWAYRLFPKFHFEDSLRRLENLGKKREIQVYLRKIRTGMLDNDVVRQLDDDDPWQEPAADTIEAPVVDSFDQLLSQQIAQTQTTPRPSLSDEQLARIERNRKMAMEKKSLKLASAPSSETSGSPMDVTSESSAVTTELASLDSTPMEMDSEGFQESADVDLQ